MKRLLLLLLFLPSLLKGQHTAQSPGNMVVKVTDTLVTKDPSTPGKEFWIVMYSTGHMKCQGIMLNGKREGVWREYIGNSGLIANLVEYSAGKKNGASLTLNGSGMVQADETFVNDILEGTRITYNESGKIKIRESFINGKLSGNRVTYYDNGKIQEEGSYIDGNRDGTVKWYLQSGNLSAEFTYKNGIMDGPSKTYDENGIIKQEGLYRNDLEEGEWKEYKDGQLVSKTLFKEGKKQE